MRRCPVRLSVLFVAPLLLGPLALGQPAQGAPHAEDAAGAKILRVPWEGGIPENLDPQQSEGEDAVSVSGLDFEGLTRIDEEMNTVPGAAEAWAFSADGLALTFTLHDNLTYADGSPLTAERFRYAIERACDPMTAAPLAVELFSIVGCEAFSTGLTAADDPVAYEAARASLGVRTSDDRTLELRLTQPAADLPTAVSRVTVAPVKQEAVEADPAGWWRNPASRIGNGPFRLVAVEADQANPRLRFAANDRYWGGRPKLDGIDYVYFPNAGRGDVVEAYRRGEVDVALPWEEHMPAVEADPVLSAELLWTPIAHTAHINFNLNREPFQDQKVREAFAYGFDRAAWCREIEFGDCIPTLSWIAAGSPGYIETDAFAFNPDKARQALAESSYRGPENLPEIVWYYGANDPEELRDADWLATQYREVLGFELTLVTVADGGWDALYADPANLPQLEWGFWGQQIPTAQIWLSVYWTCDSQIHAAQYGYCNPAFDALVARADAELDPVRRLALYEEAHRLLLADAPTIVINQLGLSMLIKPYVVGYVVTPTDLAFPGWFTPLTIDIVPAA